MHPPVTVVDRQLLLPTFCIADMVLQAWVKLAAQPVS
jgi:hypothetical protein